MLQSLCISANVYTLSIWQTIAAKGMIMTENEIGTIIVDTSVKIHQSMGPGLLESVYETVLAHKLSKSGLIVRRQEPIPICFEGVVFDEGFRADLIVENKLILELKSVESIHAVHKKQLLTYLKLSGLKLGYLLNFGDELMKNGIVRIINGQL
jgi:GxxExxY protein